MPPSGGHRAKPRSKNVVCLLLNAEPKAFSEQFAKLHGPSVCAFAFRVKNAVQAYRRALDLNAWGVEHHAGPMELNIPAIKGIGDSLLYLVDRYGDRSIYDVDFELSSTPQNPGVGLFNIDHLTHNVHRGRMDLWAEFYQRLFNFREIRYFDIEGKLTGLKSRAMTSPCGKIRIPINESSDDKSQIEEYLHEYHGEGVQHIALEAGDIYATVERLRANGIQFLDTPDTYYEMIDQRLPNHGEDVARLKKNGILIDGDPAGGILLQIFTKNVIGPIFFEIIQRKGNEGFGEGNFKALFESIELDQLKRGVLSKS